MELPLALCLRRAEIPRIRDGIGRPLCERLLQQREAAVDQGQWNLRQQGRLFNEGAADCNSRCGVKFGKVDIRDSLHRALKYRR